MPPKVQPKPAPAPAPKPGPKPPAKISPPAKVSPKAKPAEDQEESAAAPSRSSSGSTKARNARTYDFGDESVKGGYNDRPESFKGKAGITYILRIVTTPVAYFGAHIENSSDPSKSFFMTSRADFDTCAAAYEGDDREAVARAAEQCPLWERQFKIKQKFVCGIYVVGKEDSRGRFEKVGQFFPWSFGPERYQSLTNVARSLPSKPDGSRVSIHAVELRASCKDDRFQKFDIVPVTSKNDMKMTWADVWDEVKGYFEGDDRKSVCDKIEQFLEPDSKRDMIASIDRAQGASQNAVEEPDDPPARRSAPKSSPKSTPAKAASRSGSAEEDSEPESALDDALSDVEGDGSGEEASDDTGESSGDDDLDDVE